jgi:hypothetical protein
MTSVDAPPHSGHPDFVGPLLVADTRAFVAAWRDASMADAAAPDRGAQLAELLERSKTLQLRARAAGVGGLAHHLGAAQELLQLESPDAAALQECLRNVLELAWQFEQEIELQRMPRGIGPVSEVLPAESAPVTPLPAIAPVVERPSSAPPGPPPAPWPGWKRRSTGSEPNLEPPRPETVQDGVAALSHVLGLPPLAPAALPALPASPSVEPSVEPAVEAAAVLVPAEFVVDDDEDELSDEDWAIRLDFSRRTGRHSLMPRQHEVAIDLPANILPAFRRSRAARRPWLLAALGLSVLGVTAVALAFSGRFGTREMADTATLTRSAALLPLSSARSDVASLNVLLAQVHGYGSEESPALAQLIDAEAAALTKAVTEPCAAGSRSCALAEEGRQILQQEPLAQRPARPPGGAEWLSGLERPRIGVQEDARVGSQLEFHTRNPVGRDIFQALLFQCAPIQQHVRDALRQRGLPLELLAVAMVESGCAPDAESPAGGRGLWQFTLDRAHAYRLAARAGVIDERISVVKSTDAALELLSDLRQKLGSWELALASYQLGPFSVLARARQARPGVEYGDLANAQRLPAETVLYVAKVQAFALILTNLEHFRFEAVPVKTEPASAALLVPAGTRIGLVARAVGSSASRIRELNPELIAESVPGGAGEQLSLLVPRDADPRAHDALERLIADADGADECVPLNFDWGRQRLTRAMLSRCKR